MNPIAERAASLGLFGTANAIADAKLDPDSAPRDPRLVDPVSDDPQRILGQMARRGHDPKLVAGLWTKLAGRPFERALVATDVLAQAVWSPRDPLLPELREAAASLGAFRPKAGEVGVDLEHHPAKTLVLAKRGNVYELMAMALEMDLGALEALRANADELIGKLATRESVLAYAKLAQLARLPTLASVYLDWLMRSVGWRGAGLELCETLFDAGVAQKIPGDAMRPGDVAPSEERDVGEYLLLRAHMSIGDTDTANGLVLSIERPRWAGGPSARLDTVRAHLGLLYGHGSVGLARVEEACRQAPLWRYGAKVRALIAAALSPNRALELYYAYLSGFGNDHDATMIVLSLVPEPIKRQIARIVLREAYYLPHEPAPWKLLGALFGRAEPIAEDVDARLRDQSLPLSSVTGSSSSG